MSDFPSLMSVIGKTTGAGTIWTPDMNVILGTSVANTIAIIGSVDVANSKITLSSTTSKLDNAGKVDLALVSQSLENFMTSTEQVVTANTGATSIDLSLGQVITLNQSISSTVTFNTANINASMPTSKVIPVVMIRNTTGNYTMSISGTVKVENSSPLIVSGVNGMIDVLYLYVLTNPNVILVRNPMLGLFKAAGQINNYSSNNIYSPATNTDLTQIIPGTLVSSDSSGNVMSTSTKWNGISITTPVNLVNCNTDLHCFDLNVATITGNTLTLDASISPFGYVVQNANINSVVINNLPSKGLFTLFRVQDNTSNAYTITFGGGYTVTSGFKITNTPNAYDIITINTLNGGTNKLVQSVNNFG